MRTQTVPRHILNQLFMGVMRHMSIADEEPDTVVEDVSLAEPDTQEGNEKKMSNR